MNMSALVGVGLVVGLGLLVGSCSGTGKPLGGDAPRHHLENGFRNPPNSIKRGAPLGRRLQFFGQAVWKNLTMSAPQLPERHALPRAEAKQGLAAMGDADYVNWIGHSTFLVRLDGLTVLTDPVFSRRASPLSFAGPERLVPPGLRLEDLPPIDVVVVSHAHYDHLDTKTLENLPGKQNVTAIVPLGLGKYFKGYGKVHEVDWYDSVPCRPAPARSK